MIKFKTRVLNSLTIHTTWHRLVIAIDIVDDGPGIPVSIRESLFLPMVSGNTGGSGIGLSVAQQLANRLRGIVEHRRVGDSTVFTVLLPILSEAVDESEHG